MRPPCRDRVPSAPSRSFDASIRSAIADLERVDVFLLRALEQRRIEREQHLPGRTVSPMVRTARLSTQPSARGRTCRTRRSSKPDVADRVGAARQRAEHRGLGAYADVVHDVRRYAYSGSSGVRRTPARSPCPSRPSSGPAMCGSGRVDCGSTAASRPRRGAVAAADSSGLRCAWHVLREHRPSPARQRQAITLASDGCQDPLECQWFNFRIATLMALLPRGNPPRTGPARDLPTVAGASGWSRARRDAR